MRAAAFALCLLAGAGGCGGDDSPAAGAGGSGPGAGGSGPGAGGSGPGAGGSGGGGGAMATGCGMPVVVLANVDARALAPAGTALVFADHDMGEDSGLGTKSAAIRKIGRDGTGAVTLYTAAKSHEVQDIKVAGDTIYFIEAQPVDGDQKAFLYKMPLAGGAAPARVSPTSAGYDSLLTRLFAVDGGSAYVFTPRAKMQIVRVSLGDGAETVIAERDGTVFTNLQLLGDTVWFTASQGADGIFKTPAAATAPAATRVGTGTCVPLAMSVTPNGIFCGGALGVQKLDLNGENPTTALDLLQEDPGAVNPTPPDGDAIYVVPVASPSMGRTLRRLPTGGGAATKIACDRRTTTYFVAGPMDLFWTETRAEGGVTTKSIVRLPK